MKLTQSFIVNLLYNNRINIYNCVCIIIESESFKPSIFKTTEETAFIVFLLSVAYNLHSKVRMGQFVSILYLKHNAQFL